MYYIDQEKCSGCGMCVDRCPAGAISVENRKAKIDENKCTNCGECLNACPFGAIYTDLDLKPAPPDNQDQRLPNSRFWSGQGQQRGSGYGMGRGFGRGMGRGFRRGPGRGGSGRGYR